ncbi:MAG: class I SAM-dependent methyltransferase [Candidatus Sumerlaeota bacterium]|nr:class I SAM-dependent methyltransferase [Candidatus Sumerlaeota bacterium]
MPTPFDKVSREAEQYGAWDARLRLEIPFFTTLLREHEARRVCDAGCGEGRHTVALAQMGFAMTGVDPRAESFERGRRLAREASVEVAFHQGEFRTLPEAPGAPFDAIVALGNALSLTPDWNVLPASLHGIATALVPHGLFLCQVPNYRRLEDPATRWNPLRETEERRGDSPVLLLKHFAPWGNRYFAAEFVRIWKDPDKGWVDEVKRTRLLALTRERLETSLAVEFEIVDLYGHADGRPFDDDAPDVIVLARRKE